MLPFEKDDELDEILSLETRRKLYNTVNNFPGLHFREIQRRTGLATGELKYHLIFLESNKIISSRKEGEMLRFYPLGLAESEKKLLGLLRQQHLREIIIFLVSNPKASHRDFVTQLKHAPSTISWYLKKLTKSGVIQYNRNGPVNYVISNRTEIIKVLITYRSSFLDKLVDGFVNLWEDGYFDKSSNL